MTLRQRLKHKRFDDRCPRVVRRLDYPFYTYIAAALRRAYIEGYKEGQEDKQ